MEKIKKHGISCLVKLFFCYILYGLMFNEFLVNKQDGIWNGTYFNAGNWELSLGRWAIRYWDKLHYGISVHPFSSVVTLVFFIFGTCLLIDLFNIKAGSLMDYLISGLFLSNVVVYHFHIFLHLGFMGCHSSFRYYVFGVSKKCHQM